MKLKTKTINEIADMICGNFDQDESFFVYRSSSYLSEFLRTVTSRMFTTAVRESGGLLTP